MESPGRPPPPDAVPTAKKVSGVGAVVEIVAYPKGHCAVAGHPLNNETELLASISYLYDRLQREAAASSG